MAIEQSNYPTSGEINPAGFAVEVTPAVTVLARFTRGIYIGVAGNLTVTMAAEGNSVTFTNVAAGSVLPIRVSSIDAGTTAGGLVALY